MTFTLRSRLRDILVSSFLIFLWYSNASARPIPHEQLVTLGDFPDFVALTSNVSSEYFSNDILQQFVHGLGEHYPDYVSVFRIGDSVNGVPILAMDIGAAAGDLCVPSIRCCFNVPSPLFCTCIMYSRFAYI